MKAAIVGIGIHPFGRTPTRTGREQGAFAARAALDDAGLGWRDVQVAVGGSISAGAADSLVSELGLIGIPFINVANGCATGASALVTAAALVESGAADVAMAVGFDKHPKGAFAADPEAAGLGRWYAQVGLMMTTQFFSLKLRRYMHENGITQASLTRVAAKAYRNGEATDYAWRRKPLSEEEIATSPMISDPLTQYMFCSPGEGAAAVVIARTERARELASPAVFIRAITQRTRLYGSFEVFSPWLAPERSPSPTTAAARAAFEEAGIGPKDVDVAQLQDTESGAEIIHMAETGLCDHGEQETLIGSGATEIGGRLPINTDGGCIANGEPVGASGLRQVYEVALQLRGQAGGRQVGGTPRVGFTHVYGAPGVSACTVLSR